MAVILVFILRDLEAFLLHESQIVMRKA